MGDYDRLKKLGSWLYKYLKAPVTPWGLEKLADEALVLLDVDYNRNEDDPVINSLITLLADDPYRMPLQKKRNTKVSPARSKWLWASIHVSDMQPFEANPADKYNIINKRAITADLVSAVNLPMIIMEKVKLLRERTDVPWEYILANGESEKEDNILLHLLENYNYIRQALVQRGKKFEVVRRMVYPESFKEGQWNNFSVSDQWVRLPALVSYIFISFLEVGGRDYLGVCHSCEELFLAKRKGRKKFCSDKCRVYFGRKMKGDSTT